MIGTIHIAELTIECVLGLYPEERESPRSVVLEVELDVDLAPVLASGSIGDTVDYDEVCSALTRLAQDERFELIEVFVERGCALILERWPRVVRCRVKVCKPGSVPNTRYVAVSVDRQVHDRQLGGFATTGSLDDKIVLVTGGARRIGAEIVSALSSAGARVAIHCHCSTQAANELAARIRSDGGDALVVEGDLRRDDDRAALIDAVVAWGGRLDCLINNASVFERRPLSEIESTDLARMFQLNAEAPLILSRLALPHLRAAGGSVINIIDNASGSRPWAFHSHYCASKAALLSITRSLAVELAPSVRVNAVGPGAIIFQDWETAQRRDSVLGRIPMARLGQPSEIAATVLFLIGGPAYITGQIIHVDGGWSAA